jgi:hypothetical protein
MGESSDLFEPGLEGFVGLEHGPEDVDASAGQGDEGQVVTFALASFAVVEGATVRSGEQAEGGLTEDAFEALEKTRARENNFTLHGSQELAVEVHFPELARICVEENDRRLAPYDARLIRPRLVPAVLRLAQHITKGPKTK